MASISDVAAQAQRLPASSLHDVTETVWCELLPSVDGKSWGRECELKRLNLHEQIVLLGRIQDGVATDRKRREQKDLDAPKTDEESEQFHESVWLMVLGCIEPSFDELEAVRYITTDKDGVIACSEVAQFLLHHIRTFNAEARGMEDTSAGLKILRRLPLLLQRLEQAYLDGSLTLLLNGKVPESQQEMAQFIDRWGGIISHVVLNWVRKKAHIEASANAEVLLEKIIDLLIQMGHLGREGGEEENAGEVPG